MSNETAEFLNKAIPVIVLIVGFFMFPHLGRLTSIVKDINRDIKSRPGTFESLKIHFDTYFHDSEKDLYYGIEIIQWPMSHPYTGIYQKVIKRRPEPPPGFSDPNGIRDDTYEDYVLIRKFSWLEGVGFGCCYRKWEKSNT